MDAPDQWLVRNPQNFIRGPYTQSELCKLIADGGLYPHDEVCHANHFWFYLHETEEVLKQLGVSPPKAPIDPDDDAYQAKYKNASDDSYFLYRYPHITSTAKQLNSMDPRSVKEYRP